MVRGLKKELQRGNKNCWTKRRTPYAGNRDFFLSPWSSKLAEEAFGFAMREVLGQLAEGVANRWNRQAEAVARRTAQRVSFLIHSENAQAVLDTMKADLVTDQETPLVL